MTRFKIILVDDHPVLRESIAAFLRARCGSELVVVGEAADGPTALRLAQEHRPDLALLDLHMPGVSGIETLRRLKQVSEGTRVLVFSVYEDQAHVVEAIHAGADDYLFKGHATAQTVADHMLQTLRGHLAQRNPLQRKLLFALRNLRADRLPLGPGQLTKAELEVIKLAAHRGLSMKEIAVELGRTDGALSENTVRKHLQRIYSKLGARNQTHAIALAIKYGLISVDDTQPAARRLT
ncbi:MAG: response regulator transcription factor [Proteobacteria bacterium]|nr:response regulator transcription factor [Pseudomonadota bacterium]